MKRPTEMEARLIQKYNVPGPRYTSYPTVPYWDGDMPEQAWKQAVKATFEQSQEGDGISIYVHLPYCESLCTYCGCNTRITKNHKVEKGYIDTVLQEWSMYLELFETRPSIREIHLGGGTPTFFSPENLERLVRGLLQEADICEEIEFGFEGHPNNTTEAHLKTLFDLGFRRVSFGIQDLDPEVQRIINRIQPLENVKKVTRAARRIGYTSINFDLVYGLPRQRLESVIRTIRKTLELRPERIAFYSYAHVPWQRPGQRLFTESDLPNHAAKRRLYETGKQLLLEAGYMEIGMDHFALPGDPLYHAAYNGKLHRNFMGYSSHYTQLLVGLGTSAISDTWTAFGQNLKKVEDYQAAVKAGRFPIFRGHLLTREDLAIRRHILNIMCRLGTQWYAGEGHIPALEDAIDRWKEMENDGLVNLRPFSISVTDKGRPFIRNICMALDARLWRKQPETQLFSQVI